ncbi:MAG TPA: GIY-YIG nuclease family protein [Rhizomicrobium sp.]|jgi:hypothetical protein|nr:GIY-YIG nuclease family protein [Rhizomicrobium sp.]
MQEEQRQIELLFKRLLESPLKKFPSMGRKVDAPNLKGVYVIYDPKRRVLHVGSTPRAKKGIYQRLRDHIASQSSFTQKWFKGQRKGVRLREGYGFRCLPVAKPRERALLEALAIGLLCPAHIGHGLE